MTSGFYLAVIWEAKGGESVWTNYFNFHPPLFIFKMGSGKEEVFKNISFLLAFHFLLSLAEKKWVSS